MAIVAVDLGGTKIRAAFFDEKGTLLRRTEREALAQEGPEAVIDRIKASIQEVTSTSSLQAIAIACPGPLNPWQGIVHQTPNLPGWHDVPLASLINETFRVPTYLDNDASLAAFGEHRFGAGRGIDDMVFMILGTGIGGGIIAHGRLLRGWKGMAAEVGHIVLDPDESTPVCSCGNRGCLEALASGTAIAREARERIQAGAQTSLVGMVGGQLERVTARIVAQAAREGDTLAQEILNQAGFYIGVGIATLLNVLNPQAVILGGGVSRSLPLFQEAIWGAVKAHTMASIREGIQIIPTALGDDAGLFGAFALALEGGPS